MPHQERPSGFPRLHSAPLLQSCPFWFESVPTALPENAGQALGLLPPLYPISLHPQSQHFVEGSSSQRCSVRIFHSVNSRSGMCVGGGGWQRVTQFISKMKERPESVCFTFPLLLFQVDDVCLKSHSPLRKTFAAPQQDHFFWTVLLHTQSQ